jgi:hypothetical protein
VASRQDRQARRAGRIAAAVVATVVVASCTAPAPSAPRPASIAPPTPVRAANETPRPTRSAMASADAGDAAADPDAPILNALDVRLHNAGGRDVLTLTVQDRAGHLVEASPGDEHGAMPEAAAADALEIGPGRTTDTLRVQLTASPCDREATLDVAADGRTLTVTYAPRDACDAMAVGLLVELRFDGPVDATDFTGTERRAPLAEAVDPTQVHPTAVAFADERHGWVGVTARDGRAAVLETTDGGTTWSVSVLGRGTITTIAPAPGGAIAGIRCAEGVADCGAGTWSEADGSWFETRRDHLVSVAVDGETAIALFEVAGEVTDVGMPVTVLRTTDDGSLTWADGTIPCMDAASVAILSGGGRLVLCAGQGAGGGSLKALFAADDAAGAWEQVASTEDRDGLPYMGAPVHMSVAPDGIGVLWGPRVPVMGTTDAGRTWSDLGLTAGDADGDTRNGIDGRAAGRGLNAVLVEDSPRRSTILSITTDGGRTWTEAASWPWADWWSN